MELFYCPPLRDPKKKIHRHRIRLRCSLPKHAHRHIITKILVEQLRMDDILSAIFQPRGFPASPLVFRIAFSRAHVGASALPKAIRTAAYLLPQFSSNSPHSRRLNARSMAVGKADVILRKLRLSSERLRNTSNATPIPSMDAETPFLTRAYLPQMRESPWR